MKTLAPKNFSHTKKLEQQHLQMKDELIEIEEPQNPKTNDIYIVKTPNKPKKLTQVDPGSNVIETVCNALCVLFE